MKNKYTNEFKLQIIELYKLGKSPSQLIEEYNIGYSTFYKWISYYKKSGSFKWNENLPIQEKEINKLKKENRQLKMEIDILKRATLIIAKNSN